MANKKNKKDAPVWKNVPSVMSLGRYGCAVVSVDTTVYAMGGYNRVKGGGILRSCEAFNVDKPQEGWRAIPSMPSRRYGATAVVVETSNDGKLIYVLGGRDPRGITVDTVEVYDVQSHRWRQAPSMIYPRCFCAAVAVQSNAARKEKAWETHSGAQIIVMGGKSHKYPHGQNSVEALDIDVGATTSLETNDNAATEGVWRQLDPMKSVRSHFGAVWVEEKRSIYVFGGYHKDVHNDPAKRARTASTNGRQRYWIHPMEWFYGYVTILATYGGTVGTKFAGMLVSWLAQVQAWKQPKAELYHLERRAWKTLRMPLVIAGTARDGCQVVRLDPNNDQEDDEGSQSPRRSLRGRSSRDCRIVLVGGSGVATHHHNTVTSYSVNTRRWKRLPPIKPKRDGKGITTLLSSDHGQMVVVVGGQNYRQREYDTAQYMSIPFLGDDNDDDDDDIDEKKEAAIFFWMEVGDAIIEIVSTVMSIMGVLFVVLVLSPIRFFKNVWDLLRDKGAENETDNDNDNDDDDNDQSLKDLGPPPQLFCPISMKIMKDPVVADDGYTYERSAIEQVLSDGSRHGSEPRSPMTGQVLQSTKLTENEDIQRELQAYNNKL